MSLGTQFLSSVLADNDRQALHRINTEWLSEEELTAYQAVVDHVRQFGELPSHQTMRHQRVNLPSPSGLEPPSYYVTELPKRAIHSFLRERLPVLTQNMEARDIATVREIVREMNDFASLTGSAHAVTSMQAELATLVESLATRQRVTGLLGVTTGYPLLDELTNGWMPADVNVVVGRPGVGKSYTLFKMMGEAWKAGTSMLIISMEMSVAQCVQRLVGMETGISPTAIRKGHISRWIEDEFFGTIQAMGDRPAIHFMAGSGRITMDDIDVLVQELMPEMVGIDAGYLVTPGRKRQRSSRREFVADTVEEFKGITVARNIPGLITVQFNRSVDSKSNKELDLNMIGEADAIGQIGSNVLGVREGAGAFRFTRRRHTLMKNREGEGGEYDAYFRFSPMRFGQVLGTERNPDGTPWTRSFTGHEELADFATAEPDDTTTPDGLPEGHED